MIIKYIKSIFIYIKLFYDEYSTPANPSNMFNIL